MLLEPGPTGRCAGRHVNGLIFCGGGRSGSPTWRSPGGFRSSWGSRAGSELGGDLYPLSGTVCSAPGGIGGMSFDSWGNAALLDTDETEHIALLLSAAGGSSSMKLYNGDNAHDSNGNPSGSFLARTGLAYESRYCLKSSLPSWSNTNAGTFTTSSGSGGSSFSVTKISNTSGSTNSLDSPDNDLAWAARHECLRRRGYVWWRMRTPPPPQCVFTHS